MGIEIQCNNQRSEGLNILEAGQEKAEQVINIQCGNQEKGTVTIIIETNQFIGPGGLELAMAGCSLLQLDGPFEVTSSPCWAHNKTTAVVAWGIGYFPLGNPKLRSNHQTFKVTSPETLQMFLPEEKAPNSIQSSL